MTFIFLSIYVCFVFVSIVAFSKHVGICNRIAKFAKDEWNTTVASSIVVCALVWPLVYFYFLAYFLLDKSWRILLWFADKMLSKPEINSSPDNYRKASNPQ